MCAPCVTPKTRSTISGTVTRIIGDGKGGVWNWAPTVVKYPLGMRSSSKTGYFVGLYFLVSLLLIFLDSRKFLKPVHNLVGGFTTPVTSSLFNFRRVLVSPLTSVFSVGDLEKENVSLRERNVQLEGIIAQIGALKEENEHMRRLLAAGLPPSMLFSPARVVSVSGGSLFLTSEKVQEGLNVITSQDKGVFLGRVRGVYGGRGEVALPVSVDSKIPAIVRDKDTGDRRASGLVLGKGGRAIVDQVFTGETLKEGGLILTSGDQGVPPELLVGFVGEILPVKEGAFRQAEIVLPVDYYKLTNVFLVTKY